MTKCNRYCSTQNVYHCIKENYRLQICPRLAVILENKPVDMYYNLPVLSAQLSTAPTGKASEIRNLPPAEPPRPEKEYQ